MKIRHGFVSNSSSSSFVVAFDKEPKSMEDVKIAMFGAEEHFPSTYSEYSYSTNQIAETVWRDIQGQRPNHRKNIRHESPDYYPDPYPEFMKQNKGKFIYVFEYADEDGDYYCTLEHGGIFDKLNHMRNSKH